MCLIAFAWDVHPDYALLLAANRDEFHGRPAAPLAPWTDLPIVGGRDLQEGGGWLAAGRNGRFAAVTNVRGPDAGRRFARSRGALVADFLTSSLSAGDYGRTVEPHAAEFGGFNLLLFDGTRLLYASNRPVFTLQAVAPGLHGLSNAQLDTPWPKVLVARDAVKAWLQQDEHADRRVLEAFGSPVKPPDEALPSTGVGLAQERALSPPFIHLPTYGTRCTTLVRIARAGGAVALFERRYDADGAVSGESSESFGVAPA